jgi:pyridoxine 4-dehydrogenase
MINPNPSHRRAEIPVGTLGFGAMRLTGLPAFLDRSTAVSLVRRAVELTFVDTADSYDFGENEQVIAEAVHPYRDIVIGTKGGQVNIGDQWIPLGRPDYLRQQAELSLRRLRQDCVQLYQLQRVDPTIPLADQVGALRLPQEEGKVRHVGLSEVTVDQLIEAEEITPIASVQNRYSVADRASEDVLRYCESRGIAFIRWLPVSRVISCRQRDPVARVASRLCVSRTQVALAWLLRRSQLMLPIPGTSSTAHLEENMAARQVELSDDDYVALSAPEKL